MMPSAFINRKEYALYVEISTKWDQRDIAIQNLTNAYHLIEI